MYAYVTTYQMPNDDPERLRARVRIALSGASPTASSASASCRGLRLQRAFARREGEPLRPSSRCSCGATGCGSPCPHGTVAYLLVRRRDQFARGAAQIYAVFDLGLIGYWALPTAPPWYAAKRAPWDRAEPGMRRLMREHGQAVWKGAWGPLYDVLGGNPLAAMPSLHFATSVMAAHVLADAGPVQGALGWAYAVTLGFALVYLGEHYVDRPRSPGWPWPRACAATATVPRRRCARSSRTLQRLEARRARMSSAPVDGRNVGAAARGRR